MSNSSSSPETNKSTWVIGFIGLVIAGLVGFLVLYLNSGKQGTEFSPDDFTQRDFSYTKIDFLNLTLHGIQYEDRTTDFQRNLLADGWIKPVTNSEKTWHLVGDSVTKTLSPDFDASILIKYLDMPIWTSWNADPNNLEKAKCLWPAVADLARNYSYWAIPDLMDLAIGQGGLSDIGFQVQVKKIVSLALLQNGRKLIEEENWEDALRSLSTALDYRSSKEILEMRAMVYDELDKPSLAKTDRDAARALQ